MKSSVIWFYLLSELNGCVSISVVFSVSEIILTCVWFLLFLLGAFIQFYRDWGCQDFPSSRRRCGRRVEPENDRVPARYSVDPEEDSGGDPDERSPLLRHTVNGHHRDRALIPPSWVGVRLSVWSRDITLTRIAMYSFYRSPQALNIGTCLKFVMECHASIHKCFQVSTCYKINTMINEYNRWICRSVSQDGLR